MLLLPSIFAPESWAHTFLEGLLKVPLDEYAGKRLVEVGSGSGWICIALARFTRLARIHGVDLNPHSAPVAWCNAWLNGDEALVSRLSFGESDLLRQVPEAERWDFVVGCIPQVLRGEGLRRRCPRRMSRRSMICPTTAPSRTSTRTTSGWGSSRGCWTRCPSGSRRTGGCCSTSRGGPGAPSSSACSRGGVSPPRVRVARRVMQAADTDIRPLVALEQRTRREFEFFMEAHSPEPLRAATALGGSPRAIPSGTRWRCGRRGCPASRDARAARLPARPGPRRTVGGAGPGRGAAGAARLRGRAGGAPGPRRPSCPTRTRPGTRAFAPTGGALPRALLRACGSRRRKSSSRPSGSRRCTRCCWPRATRGTGCWCRATCTPSTRRRWRRRACASP